MFSYFVHCNLAGSETQPNMIVLPGESIDKVKQQIEANPIVISDPKVAAEQKAKAQSEAEKREAQVAPLFVSNEVKGSISFFYYFLFSFFPPLFSFSFLHILFFYVCVLHFFIK